METKSNVIGTDSKEFDGLLIMDRFNEDTVEPTAEEKEREARKKAYEKRYAQKQGKQVPTYRLLKASC